MALLGGIVLSLRHHQRAFPEWKAFQTQAFDLLHTHAMPDRFPLSCDVSVGNGTLPDRITHCRFETPPDNLALSTVEPGSDAKLWILRSLQHFQWLSPDSLHLIAKSVPHITKYPVLNTSPDVTQVDRAMRTGTRRQLLQSTNPLTLAEAVKDRLEHALHFMGLLTQIAGQLRLWEPASTEAITQLTTLGQAIADAHQFAFTTDVGCDLQFDGGAFTLAACHEGNASRVNTNISTPLDGQLWLSQNATHPTLLGPLWLLINRAPLTEALTYWLSQSTEAKAALMTVATPLHQGVCDPQSDRRVVTLRNALQAALEAHQAFIGPMWV